MIKKRNPITLGHIEPKYVEMWDEIVNSDPLTVNRTHQVVRWIIKEHQKIKK